LFYLYSAHEFSCSQTIKTGTKVEFQSFCFWTVAATCFSIMPHKVASEEEGHPACKKCRVSNL